MAKRTKAALETDTLDVVADRGYFKSEEILACDKAGITVTLPKPFASGIQANGRFGKQDFCYVAEDDVYICPAGERLDYHFTNVEKGLTLHRYWTNACQGCAIKNPCATGKGLLRCQFHHGCFCHCFPILFIFLHSAANGICADSCCTNQSWNRSGRVSSDLGLGGYRQIF